MSNDHTEPPGDDLADVAARSSLGTGALAELRAGLPQQLIDEIRRRAGAPGEEPPEEDNVRILYRRFRSGSSVADRLNSLFGKVHPIDRGPYRDGEVAAAVTATGYPISRPYIAQLRSGERTDPSPATLRALAKFFMVRPEYFSDDRYAEGIDRDLDLLTSVRNNRSMSADATAAQRDR